MFKYYFTKPDFDVEEVVISLANVMNKYFKVDYKESIMFAKEYIIKEKKFGRQLIEGENWK